MTMTIGGSAFLTCLCAWPWGCATTAAARKNAVAMIEDFMIVLFCVSKPGNVEKAEKEFLRASTFAGYLGWLEGGKK